MEPLRAELQIWKYGKLMCWPSFVFCSLFFVDTVRHGAFWPMIQFACLSGASLYVILHSGENGRTEIGMDAEGVWQTSGSTRHEMKWSEIRQIEFSTPRGKEESIDNSSLLVMHGQDKHLALLSPAIFPREKSEPMMEFIKAQAQAWGIPQRRSKFVKLSSSKNTKVARDTRRPPLSS